MRPKLNSVDHLVSRNFKNKCLSQILEDKSYDKIYKIVLHGEAHLTSHILGALGMRNSKDFEDEMEMRRTGASFQKIFRISVDGIQSSETTEEVPSFVLDEHQIKSVSVGKPSASRTISMRRNSEQGLTIPGSPSSIKNDAWEPVVVRKLEAGDADEEPVDLLNASYISRKSSYDTSDPGRIGDITSGADPETEGCCSAVVTNSSSLTKQKKESADAGRKADNLARIGTPRSSKLAHKISDSATSYFDYVSKSSRKMYKNIQKMFNRHINVKVTITVLPAPGKSQSSFWDEDAETIAFLYIFDLRDLRALELIDVMISRVGISKSYKPPQEYLVALSVPSSGRSGRWKKSKSTGAPVDRRKRKTYEGEVLDKATEEKRWEYAQDICMDGGAELMEVINPSGTAWVEQLMQRVVTRAMSDKHQNISYRTDRCWGCLGTRTKKSTNITAIGQAPVEVESKATAARDKRPPAEEAYQSDPEPEPN